MAEETVEETPPPPNIFQDVRLLTKQHFDHSIYVPNRSAEYASVDALEALSNKVTALYFSASWCPPCQEFTPMLKQIYESLKERGQPFQIVFISFDKRRDAMSNYFLHEHGDWLALPFDHSKKAELVEKYKVNAIPKLIVVQPDGDVITTKGRKDVQDKGMLCFRNWLNNASICMTPIDCAQQGEHQH